MKKYLLPAIVIIIGAGLYIVAHFYITKTMDYWQRPWAYNRDDNAPLLVRKWQGNFKDPDGINKEIKMEILVPESDSLRWAKAADFKRKPNKDIKRNRRFEGTAIVTSKLGTEYYELSSLVNNDDIHSFELYFSTNYKKKEVLPNFALSGPGEGPKWQGNKMNFLADFTYHKARNTIFYNPTDSRHKKKAPIHLNRVKI